MTQDQIPYWQPDYAPIQKAWDYGEITGLGSCDFKEIAKEVAAPLVARCQELQAEVERLHNDLMALSVACPYRIEGHACCDCANWMKDRAEKAEARVAELEAEVEKWKRTANHLSNGAVVFEQTARELLAALEATGMWGNDDLIRRAQEQLGAEK